jgi:hypothetical protein
VFRFSKNSDGEHTEGESSQETRESKQLPGMNMRIPALGRDVSDTVDTKISGCSGPKKTAIQ